MKIAELRKQTKKKLDKLPDDGHGCDFATNFLRYRGTVQR